ncbi:TRM11 family SAM-dependent methyltransferase [Actinomadura harenae]|uniref:Methyltransferase n=1 Tax=Actinomadura harenae TaxID=2483351 RepID=A0A3M2LIQ3_9ACTN|nr:DNA methyltransferase [Actinomadura harenae]RMI36996.1 site-specific DNA-methyltransferase [Actinomadura harenae]
MTDQHTTSAMLGPSTSVLVTGQRPSRLQRRGRYVPEAMKHPARMLPEIAAQVISAYTRPGELVIDPMCGIGTTLVEAIHLGRDAAGVEYEDDFAHLTARNISHAQAQGATGHATVTRGDAHNITALLADHRGRAALVLTSPPYGASTHGHIRATRDSREDKIQKWDNAYSADRGNLAHSSLDDLLSGFAQILTGCTLLLRPGGVAAVTVRPIRVRGELVDLPGRVSEAARSAGLQPADRLAALLCGLRDGRVISRASFFQMLETRRARDRGIPACAAAHEDLLIFQRPTRPAPDCGPDPQRGDVPASEPQASRLSASKTEQSFHQGGAR